VEEVWDTVHMITLSVSLLQEQEQETEMSGAPLSRRAVRG